MLICRGNALELDALRVIAGTIAQEFDRRMLLGLWDDGETKSYMIAMDEAPVTRSPGFEPIALALPDGAFITVAREEAAPRTPPAPTRRGFEACGVRDTAAAS